MNTAMPHKPSTAFIAASWVALLLGAAAYLIGLFNAATMALNEKGYYLTLLLFGLFAAVSLQKSVRDRVEGIPVSGLYYALCWFALLSALMLLHDSRRRTRVDGTGALVPLDEQDRRLWDRSRIARGIEQLGLAAGATGPYLPQAVIAAVHATARRWDETDWNTICTAYDRLLAIGDSPVARANRALAIGFRDGFAAGLAELELVAEDSRLARANTVASIRADLLRRAGMPAEAAHWYRVALEANTSEPGAAFLRRRIAECGA